MPRRGCSRPERDTANRGFTMRHQYTCTHCGAAFTSDKSPTNSHAPRFCSYRCSAYGREPHQRRPPDVRFWKHVRKTESCWIWTGGTITGYGQFHPTDTRVMKAHRFSWELHYGPIPAGLWVLHRCDTPPCVRPDHLFLGTHADNMADARAKGRLRRRKELGQL